MIIFLLSLMMGSVSADPGPAWHAMVLKNALERSAANPGDCAAQRQAISVVLHSLPADCSGDVDCKGMYLDPHVCEPPRAYKVGAESALPPDWPAVAARARKACAPEWGKDPACSPEPADAHCKSGHCVLGIVPPPAPAFGVATLNESCAPSDGPSMEVMFKAALGQEFPHLVINWWGDGKPARKPGTYTLSGLLGGKASQDFTAAYCRTAGNCAWVQKVHLKVHVTDGGKGEAEVEAETRDGDPIKATAPILLLPPSRMMCG